MNQEITATLVRTAAEFGVVGVVLWYLLTRWIPRREKRHDEMMTTIQAAHAVETKETRTAFHASLEVIVTHCDKELSRRDELDRAVQVTLSELKGTIAANAHATTGLRVATEELAKEIIRSGEPKIGKRRR